MTTNELRAPGASDSQPTFSSHSLVSIDGRLHPHAIESQDLETFCKYFPNNVVRVIPIQDTGQTELWTLFRPTHDGVEPPPAVPIDLTALQHLDQNLVKTIRPPRSPARYVKPIVLAVIVIVIAILAFQTFLVPSAILSADLVGSAFKITNNSNKPVPPALYSISTGIVGEAFSYNVDRSLPPNGTFTIEASLFRNNTRPLLTPTQGRELTVLPSRHPPILVSIGGSEFP